MKKNFLFALLLISASVFSQNESDSLYERCPVAIKDPVTGNNYFIEHQPATVKAYRNSGEFTIVIEQKGQFFSMFFRTRKFNNKGKYKIASDANNRDEIIAKYSFRSGESVAYINVSSGKVETTYDKATKLWHIKVDGIISEMGSGGVTNFKALADFYIQ